MRRLALIAALLVVGACGAAQLPQVPPQAAALGQAAGLPQVPQLPSTAGLVAGAAGALGQVPCTGGLPSIPGLATAGTETPANPNAITPNERAELEQLRIDLRAALLKADRAEQDRIDARAGQLRAERALAAATKQATK